MAWPGHRHRQEPPRRREAKNRKAASRESHWRQRKHFPKLAALIAPPLRRSALPDLDYSMRHALPPLKHHTRRIFFSKRSPLPSHNVQRDLRSERTPTPTLLWTPLSPEAFPLPLFQPQKKMQSYSRVLLAPPRSWGACPKAGNQTKPRFLDHRGTVGSDEGDQQTSIFNEPCQRDRQPPPCRSSIYQSL